VPAGVGRLNVLRDRHDLAEERGIGELIGEGVGRLGAVDLSSLIPAASRR